jgi:hypothetical protein
MIVLSCEEKEHKCKNTPAGFEYVESGGTKAMSGNHTEKRIREYLNCIHMVHAASETKLNQGVLSCEEKGQKCKNVLESATMLRNSKITVKKATELVRILEIVDNGENSKSRECCERAILFFLRTNDPGYQTRQSPALEPSTDPKRISIQRTRFINRTRNQLGLQGVY